jgi:hypothetical protein
MSQRNEGMARLGAIWIMAVFAATLWLISLFSCNPVRRVNKDEKKQLAVINNYQQKYPSKNDTTYITKEGATRTDTLVSRDTTTIQLPGNVIMRTIRDTVRVYRYRTDTVQTKVIDRSGEKALQILLQSCSNSKALKDSVIINHKSEIKSLNKKVRNLQIRFWGLIALLGIVILLIWKFK